MYSYEDRIRAVELVHQARQTRQGDDSPAGVSDQECVEGLVPGGRAAVRLTKGLCTLEAQVFSGAE